MSRITLVYSAVNALTKLLKHTEDLAIPFTFFFLFFFLFFFDYLQTHDIIRNLIR